MSSRLKVVNYEMNGLYYIHLDQVVLDKNCALNDDGYTVACWTGPTRPDQPIWKDVHLAMILAFLEDYTKATSRNVLTESVDNLHINQIRDQQYVNYADETQRIRIGRFDYWSTPFVHPRTTFGIAVTDSYDRIEPLLRASFLSRDVHPNQLTIGHLPAAAQHLIVIFHDWLSTVDDTVYTQLRDQLKIHEKMAAVIFVDWRVGAQSAYNIGNIIGDEYDVWYHQAALDAVVVGRDVGYTLAQLVNARRGLTIHLIGVGLGAHAAYFAADWYH